MATFTSLGLMTVLDFEIACEEFASLANAEDRDIDLTHALLLISTLEHELLDPEKYLFELDKLGEGARECVEAVTEPLERVKALCEYLATESGFHGNVMNYYDPRNSLLADVLERRLGIPISLSAIYIEVGRRAGVELEGVGFPYHFMVRPSDLDGVFVDTFHGGRTLSTEECIMLLEYISGGSLRFHPRFLEPVTRRDILMRVLRNLKHIYVKQGATVRGIRAMDLMLLLDPDQPQEYRDRGLLCVQARAFRKGIGDLQRYLADDPTADDRLQIQLALQKARRALFAVN